MAKKKQLSIEERARINILAAEGFSQRSIAKKLGISKFGGFENSKIQRVDLNFWPVVYIMKLCEQQAYKTAFL